MTTNNEVEWSSKGDDPYSVRGSAGLTPLANWCVFTTNNEVKWLAKGDEPFSAASSEGLPPLAKYF